MALRYLDSFNTYSTVQIGRRWSISNTLGTFTTTIAAAGLYAPNCLRLNTANGGSGVNWQATRVFDDQATWCVGFRFRFSSTLSWTGSVTIAALHDTAGEQVSLRLNANGTLAVTRNGTALTAGTSVTTLSPNTWYFLEWKVTISSSISAGGCVVDVNGVQALSVAAGQSTKAQTPATANALRIGLFINGVSVPSGNWDFADLYLCDGTAGETGLVGDRKVVVREPAANGAHSDFTGSDGDSTNNYLLVNGAASTDDASYVKSATISQTDTYGIAAHGADITTIYALQVVYTARKDAAGSRTVVPVLRDHVGTDHVMTGWSVGDTYTQYLFLSLTDPTTGSAWGTTNFDASEWGQQIAA